MPEAGFIDHVGIGVPDLAAAKEYYDELMSILGLREWFETGPGGPLNYGPDGARGSQLFFYLAEEPGTYSRGQTGLHHLAFLVASRAVVREAHEWARAREAVILDEPELAQGHDYFRLGGAALSPDARLLAYATDTNGSERFVLKVRDLSTGTDLPDVIENWRYGIVWAADSKSFLYTDADENWRSKTVWHHRLGDAQSADRVVYREAVQEFGVSLDRSQSRAFALISSGDGASNEVRLLPTGDFMAEPVLISIPFESKTSLRGLGTAGGPTSTVRPPPD